MADNEVGLVIAVVRFFMPPPVAAPPEKQHSWQWKVFALFVAVGIALAIVFGIEENWFPYTDHYARKSDITLLSDQVKAANAATDAKLSALTLPITFVQKTLIEQAIDSKIKLQCLSTSTAERADLYSDISHLQDRYRSINAGQAYAEPNCYQVGASNTP
jgi:hypothetical protein